MDFMNTAKGPTAVSVERTGSSKNRRSGNASDEKVDLDTFILARLGKKQVLKVSLRTTVWEFCD